MFLEFLQAVTGIFVVVYDGQHALKFTLGRAQEVVGPGVHFKLPIIQKFKVENTKHTTLDLEPQVIQLSDELVYEVDCKVIYRIVDLRKAVIEIDNLVTGLQNRVVLAVQRVVQAQDRHSIKDTEKLMLGVRQELKSVEEQWGVTILQFGFSNISPSPATLEITQLDLLAREKLTLYRHLRDAGVDSEASVALISGAVVALSGTEREATRRDEQKRIALEASAIEAADELREKTKLAQAVKRELEERGGVSQRDDGERPVKPDDEEQR
jgi:regulator of protease activity HflC (stomatin/prohibitin superfamily)